jgi:cellulose synthase/poly-beta-1,6-N-acetylglucosamine synthase-like glycosyltransferase
VDIIITACNEPVDVVLDTTRAAINIDYPTSRFRVIVADDGASRELEDGVTELVKSKPEALLFYTARVKGDDDRHKAGNLNHALKFARSLTGGAAEFVSGLDADIIPMRDMLRAQMPHLLRDT